MIFYHKDQFEAIFSKVRIEYPSVLKLEHNQITMVLNNEKLNTIKSVEELIKILSDRF